MGGRSSVVRGWSGGAMVLGKLSVPRHAILIWIILSRARSYCAGGSFDVFFSRLSFLSPSLADGPI